MNLYKIHICVYTVWNWGQELNIYKFPHRLSTFHSNFVDFRFLEPFQIDNSYDYNNQHDDDPE